MQAKNDFVDRYIFNDKYFLISLAILLLAIYFPVIFAEPFSDDYIEIFKNSYFLENKGWINLWHSRRWPIPILIHYGLFQVWKYDYYAYHIINIAVHWFNCFLLFHLLKNNSASYTLRFWVVLLFAFHASNSIAIAWIIQLKTLLSLTFVLLSCYYFLSWSDERRVVSIKLFHLCFFYLCSLFCKTNIILLPLLFVLFDYTKIKTKISLTKYIYFPIMLVILLINFYYFTESKYSAVSFAEATISGDNSFVSLFISRLKFFTQSSTFYLRQFLFPYPLKSFYPHFEWATQRGWTYSLIASFSIIFWYGRKNWPILLAAFIVLLPVLGILPAPFMLLFPVADYHLYPAIPLLIIFFFRPLFLVHKKFFLLRNLVFSLFLSFNLMLIAFSLPSYFGQEAFFKQLIKDNSDYLPSYISLMLYYNERGNCKEAQSYSSQAKDLQASGKGHPRIEIPELTGEVSECSY